MLTFDLIKEQDFSSERHVENKLASLPGGDFSVACWEPGQCSTYHAHPFATETYFCFEGGGTMHTPDGAVAMTPGTFVVHPPGEPHEYENGPTRTLLFRIRFGDDMVARQLRWRGHPDWQPKPDDVRYFSEQGIPVPPAD